MFPGDAPDLTLRTTITRRARRASPGRRRVAYVITAAEEKPLEKVAALLGQQASDDLGPVIQPRIAEQVVHRAHHPVSGVVGPKHHPADLGQHDGPGALGAGLQRHVHCGHQEPVLSHVL